MHLPHLQKASDASQLPTREQQELEFRHEQLLIKRAERQQVQNVAYRGRITVIALAALLLVAIPMAVAAMLAQFHDPNSLSAPLLLLSSGGALGGGLGALWGRRIQPAGEQPASANGTSPDKQ